jgi:chorismate mutase
MSFVKKKSQPLNSSVISDPFPAQPIAVSDPFPAPPTVAVPIWTSMGIELEEEYKKQIEDLRDQVLSLEGTLAEALHERDVLATRVADVQTENQLLRTRPVIVATQTSQTTFVNEENQFLKQRMRDLEARLARLP